MSQAEIVRKSIKESRSLYADQYRWEVERVLRTVEKFEGMGIHDFKAMTGLTPTAYHQLQPPDLNRLIFL